VFVPHRICKKWCSALTAALLWLYAASVTAADPTVDTINFGRFGTVHLYKQTAQPKHVVLFVSGDGGWNLGVIDMARALADLDALVAGIDITYYLKQLAKGGNKCSYPAAEFEALSQYLQKRFNFPDYVQPVLVGYSSGATMAYAVAAQAPPNTFRSALSLGFCPDLPVSKPFCTGQGLQSKVRADKKGFDILPAPKLLTPWVVFQGEIDQVCNAQATAQFVKQTKNATFIALPKVGHGFSVQRNWMPQFREAFAKLVAAEAAPKPVHSELTDLPLVEVAAKNTGDRFAVILSGDGGWASIDRQLAEALASEGIPVVGLDSLHYFWQRRTPDEAGKDLTRIVEHYLDAWNKQHVVLIGYSRGADVLPFMANRLPPALQHRTKLIALLGAERQVDFEFQVTDWIPGSGAKAPYQTRPEVQKLSDFKLLCFYGEDELDSLCPQLDAKKFQLIKMLGGHHFGGDYQSLAKKILSAAR
jgi:type IV secretory pathway VirJ component